MLTCAEDSPTRTAERCMRLLCMVSLRKHEEGLVLQLKRTVLLRWVRTTIAVITLGLQMPQRVLNSSLHQ